MDQIKENQTFVFINRRNTGEEIKTGSVLPYEISKALIETLNKASNISILVGEEVANNG